MLATLAASATPRNSSPNAERSLSDKLHAARIMRPRLRVGIVDQRFHPGHDLRIRRRDVRGLRQVLPQVV